jgi:hypothetical protein
MDNVHGENMMPALCLKPPHTVAVGFNLNDIWLCVESEVKCSDKVLERLVIL